MLNDLVNFDEEDIKDISDNLARLWENVSDSNPCAAEGATMSVLSFFLDPKVRS